MARRKNNPAALPDQRWTPASGELPPPVTPDDTDQVVKALPIAEGNGHKVGRERHLLFCWHCDATGSVIGDVIDGTIFTGKCMR
jgi:hypothetical protein